MKKNIMLRLSAVLLVAVLLTTCVISGTWAKYTTSDSADDSANVAKWGVTVTVTGDEAFGEKYDDNISGTGTKVVSAASGTNVLAPGTKGNLGSVTIAGTPEVMVTVVVGLDVTLTGWEADGSYYCPLKVSAGDTTLYGLDYDSAAAFETAIEDLVAYTLIAADADANTDGYQVAANTNLAYTVALEWEWDFESEDPDLAPDATPEQIADSKVEMDAKDTALGNAAADSTKTTPSILIELTASVTQVN